MVVGWPDNDIPSLLKPLDDIQDMSWNRTILTLHVGLTGDRFPPKLEGNHIRVPEDFVQLRRPENRRILALITNVMSKGF